MLFAVPEPTQRSQTPHRLIHFPRPHWSRQNRSRPRALADFLFDDRARHDTHRHVRIPGEALGIPPDRRASGYVGYEEGGPTHPSKSAAAPTRSCCSTKSRRRIPTSSTSSCKSWDDGRLTDGKSRVVAFKNTILIMTSNIGSAFYSPKECARSTTSRKLPSRY